MLPATPYIQGAFFESTEQLQAVSKQACVRYRDTKTTVPIPRSIDDTHVSFPRGICSQDDSKKMKNEEKGKDARRVGK